MADKSSNHEIMRKLLSAPYPPPQMSTKSTTEMDIKMNCDSDNDSGEKLHSYLALLSGQPEVINAVKMDHNYSLPWNWRPDNSCAKPAKKLFWTNKKIKSSVSWGSEMVDVLTVDKLPPPPYDVPKARQMMDETANLVSILRSEPPDPNWEANLNKAEWNGQQLRIFTKVYKILMLDQLARLAHKGSCNEPALRRIAIDKSARRFRTAMASIYWAPKLLHWLHNALLEHMDCEHLISYVDILQTLNKKIPDLIDRLISAPVSSKINPDALHLLLKPPWDPATGGLTCPRPRRLPGNPLIVIVPFGPNGGSDACKRVQRWIPYLTAIGVVVPVLTNTNNKITVLTSLEHMMSATRAKLSELRSEYGSARPIILFGMNSGAALACQVALLESVSAVVCMGFPVNTVEDKRGMADDSLLNLTTPVLFVIGQHASTSYIDDVEDIRERLQAESGLVIIGSGDDQLRITKAKQAADGITQSMVDRCIIDEVTDFIGNILSSPPKPTPSVSHYNEHRPRYRAFEKKMKIAIHDDEIPPIRQYVATNRRGAGRGRGRGRYNTQGRTGVGISRRGGMVEKAVTRPSIENISVINAANLDHASLSGESTSFKILPQIKVLGGSEFGSGKLGSSERNLIEQLTPDRLLEMPVIIAPDNQESLESPQIKVMVSGRTRGTVVMKRRGQLQTGRLPVVGRQIRKPRIQQIPLTEFPVD